MKRCILALVLIVLGLSSIGVVHHFKKISIKEYSVLTKEYTKTLKQDLFSLMMAYPEHIIDIEVADDNKVYLVLKSGKKLLYDDKKEKTQQEKLHSPDLQDMLEEEYILGPVKSIMPEDYNPGRIRVYPLLQEVYGHSQAEIEKNLIGIKINSTYHRFNNNNKAAYYLKNTINGIDELVKNHADVWRYVYPIGGTYNYRYISKTNMLSPHSFGIAIDLAIHHDDYWQWTTRKQGEMRLLSYPIEIVDIMERNYFIWGGKWGHFDILHFEYRPEIIIKSMYFANGGKDLWYEDLPVEDEQVNKLIWLIHERLQDYLAHN